MNQKLTGVMGYSGYIGRYATEKLLRSGFKVIGGQRKKDNIFDKYENFSFEYVDVEDEKMLNAFIKKCNVVVNCVSPSHLYGKIVKDTVCKLNKIYIDPSDASFDEDRENVEGKCIASCGYIPGLSEFLPYVIAKENFDEVERSMMYQGGFDGCSPGSFVDMILGAGNKKFYGDSYLLNSKITPLSSNIKNTHETPFSDKKVIFKPLINGDNIKLQKKLNSKEFYFFCTYDDISTLGFFMKLLLDVSKYDKKTAAQSIERKLNERIKTNEKFGNQTVGAFLYFEFYGKKDGIEKSMRCKIFFKNVNRVCGYFLGEVIKEILENPEKVKDGFNYGFEIIKESYAKTIFGEIDDDEYIKIEEISPEEKVVIEEFTK